MRCLEKNKKLVTFKNYTGKSQIVDSNGNKTGEYTNTYGSFIVELMNVSPARGTANEDMFGINTDYTRTMVTSNINCSLSTTSILWVDKPTTGEHDYVVVGVAKSLNSITYAIKEVNASV